MSIPLTRSKEISGDVWCRRCGHASRFGQWVPQRDRCPHCDAPGSDRLPWTVLRLQFPQLPLRPVLGEVYRSFARK